MGWIVVGSSEAEASNTLEVSIYVGFFVAIMVTPICAIVIVYLMTREDEIATSPGELLNTTGQAEALTILNTPHRFEHTGYHPPCGRFYTYEVDGELVEVIPCWIHSFEASRSMDSR